MDTSHTADGPAVEVRGLVKRYGSFEAVRGIEFEVARGEVLALLGPNGAGKTSTVEVLEGFRHADAGHVRVLGLDPADAHDVRELRARTGVVLQSTSHYRYLTVRETLAMHRGYYEHARTVDELLVLVGLESSADKRVLELSGGQQRRLDVGVALVGRPELIFLDEPTTGFDPAARRRAWETIRSLRDLGVTVLLTTHYMEEAQTLADRVAVMRAGAIVGIGTPAELAHDLRMGSLIRFRMPTGVEVRELPDAVADVHVTESGFAELRVDDSTAAMAQLCSWAVARGIVLDGLELRAPSLEESYLRLTGGDETAAATGVGQVEVPA